MKTENMFAEFGISREVSCFCETILELFGLEDGRYTVAGNSYVYRLDEFSDWIVPSAYLTTEGGNN